jgi:hypothetical protein
MLHMLRCRPDAASAITNNYLGNYILLYGLHNNLK